MAGCNTVTYSISQNANGTIEENFALSFNQQELLDAGASTIQISFIKYNLEAKLETIKNNYNIKYRQKVSEDENLSEIEKNVYLNSFSCNATKTDDEYNFSFKYSSKKYYYYFYGITEQDLQASDKDYKLDYDFFTYKVIQESKTKFGIDVALEDGSSISLGEYLWQETYNIIKDNSSETVANAIEKPEFVYQYITTSSRLHSDGEVTKQHGYYVHSWVVDSDNTTQTIYFYSIEARREIWYAISIVITLALLAILLIINKIKTKKEIKANK